MIKQVNKTHYEFSKYMDKKRWVSLWHQIDQVLKLKPQKVLEIGPGPGLFKLITSATGISVETLDIDPELNPDYVASVFNMPFENKSFDVVCAFQMLEHLPFDKSLKAFQEMTRVARLGIIISLPDARTLWPVSFHLPKVGVISFFIPRPRLRSKVHVFDGEHYWEINKRGFPLKKIINKFATSEFTLKETFRVTENPYHRFFIFTRII